MKFYAHLTEHKCGAGGSPFEGFFKCPIAKDLWLDAVETRPDKTDIEIREAARGDH